MTPRRDRDAAVDREADSRTYKRDRIRKVLSANGRCPRCPPHAGENAGYSRNGKVYGKRGARKPRGKDKR